MKPSDLVKRYPLSAFFVLTFLVSWSGIIAVSFFTGMPAQSQTFKEIAPIAMLPLVIGPTVVSLLLIGTISGRKGFRNLFSRLLTWKISIQLYLFALLFLPILASITLFILSQFSNDFLPQIITTDNKMNLLMTGLLVGIFLTLLEELGWTGFAVPELRKRFNLLTSGLVLGAIWGAWHFLPVFYGCGDSSGNFDIQLFYPGLFFHYAGLIPFRILMTWLYDRTDSILLPWIMHAALTSCTFFILNISAAGFPLFIYYAALSSALWLTVAIIIFSKKTSRNTIT